MGKQPSSTVTELIAALHEELRALMARRNLSQRQLERLSGVSQGVISKTIFRNESAMNLSQYEFICNALGTSPSILLAMAEDSLLEMSDFDLAAKKRPEAPEPSEEDYS